MQELCDVVTYSENRKRVSLNTGAFRDHVFEHYEAGVKEVIIPNDNLAEAQALPSAITQKLKITTVQAVDEAIKAALIMPNNG